MALYCQTGGIFIINLVSCFFINMVDIKNNFTYLTEFFKLHYMTYPDSKEIIEFLKQQEKDDKFKEKEKKYLMPKK